MKPERPSASRSLSRIPTQAHGGESDQPVLIITGMHRSATSLTAMLLQSAGVDIGQRLMPASAANAMGYFEDLDFVDFHARALRANGYADNGIIAGGSVTVSERLRNEAVAIKNARAKATCPWGWKDPRTVLFLDFWNTLLPDASHVFVFRSPWEVVDSLFRRGTDESICSNPRLAIDCWMHYNSLIRDFAVRHRITCLVVESSDVLARPRAVVEAIQERLHVPLSEPDSCVREGMFSSLAKSPRETFIRDTAPEAVSLYEELQSLAESGVVRERAKPRRKSRPGTVTLEMGMADWSSIHDQGRQIAHWQNVSRAAHATIASLQQQIEMVRQEGITSAEALETASRELSESQLAVESWRQRSEAHEASASLLDQRIIALEQECAGHRGLAARNEELSRALLESQSAVESWRQRSECQEAATKTHEQTIVDLERKKSEWEDSASLWRCRYEESEKKAATLLQDLQSLRRERERLAAQTRELSLHVAEWQSYARAAIEDCERERKESAELRSSLAVIQRGREAIQEESAAVSRERDSLQARVVECEAEVRVNQQRAEAHARELERHLEQHHMILKSNSWRVTRPLRELRRWMTHPRSQIGRYFDSAAADGRSPGLGKEMESGSHLVSDGRDHATADTRQSLVHQVPEPGMKALSGLTQSTPVIPEQKAVDLCRLIAFYLPQYHRIQENDDWWGPGFTEWTNVARGRPNFDGHYQPQVPRELGFYDLSHPDVVRRQAEMARLYGITGFCFYHYWFSGRRVLEKPLEQFLQSDIELEFCICWANENWTRSWDGDTKTVLLEQKYEPGDAERFFRSVEHVLRDRRYIRVGGVPLLVVYRAKDIPNANEVFATWRRLAREVGLGGLHIAVVDFYDISDPGEVEADSLVEFPPHKFNGPVNVPDVVPSITNPSFIGGILDYRKMIAQSVHKAAPAFTYFRGIVPSWDNTARRQDSPTTIIHSTPEWYAKWLAYLRSYTRQYARSPDKAIIFINAWNEWGEGCHLEPDVKWGLQYLENTFRTRLYDPSVSFQASTAHLHADLAVALAGEKQTPAADPEPPATVNGHGPAPTANGVYYRPVSERVHRIATSLRKYPMVYGLARATYRSYRLLRG